jgi:hypothetical protein
MRILGFVLIAMDGLETIRQRQMLPHRRKWKLNYGSQTKLANFWVWEPPQATKAHPVIC